MQFPEKSYANWLLRDSHMVSQFAFHLIVKLPNQLDRCRLSMLHHVWTVSKHPGLWRIKLNLVIDSINEKQNSEHFIRSCLVIFFFVSRSHLWRFNSKAPQRRNSFVSSPFHSIIQFIVVLHCLIQVLYLSPIFFNVLPVCILQDYFQSLV